MIKYKNIKYKKGDVVKVSVEGIYFIAVINIENDKLFICHDNIDFNGTTCIEKFGMPFSYTFGFKGKELTEYVVLNEIIGSCKKNYQIDDCITQLLNMNNIPNCLFSNTILKEYNHFKQSNKDGMINLSNTVNGKKTDIKFGRFINLYSKELQKIIGFKGLTSQEIEKIHNLYLMYQSDKHITIEEFCGDEIYKGYKRDNYCKITGSLGGSCMNDKDKFLKLYAKNPQVVKLMVIKNFNKIAGRCLIWKTNCGKTLMDKRYVSDDWVNEKFNIIRKERKMIDCAYELKKNYKVTVNIENIESYPYLDTLMYLSDERQLRYFPKFIKKLYNKALPIAKNKILSTNSPKLQKYMRLRSTSGSYELMNRL